MTNAHETHLPQTNEALENTLDQLHAEDAKAVAFTDRMDIVNKLQELLEKPLDEIKADLEMLKQQYYKLRKQEVDEERAAYLAAHEGSEEGFSPVQDQLEEQFRALLNSYRERKTAMLEERQQQREINLKSKIEILEELKALVEGAEDVSKRYNEFQELQVRWKGITDIPAEQVTELWKQYHHYIETFYELLKINKELRDYDYRRNLELKTALCEAAEKLVVEKDVMSAFHQLQKLHEEWREIGPVGKEVREELWRRFKQASTEVNKRHQHHFEALKHKEKENETAKIAICEELEQLLTQKPDSFGAWDKQTAEVLQLQAKWKTFGFAPKKVNSALYERFRSGCNKFFEAKNAFYSSTKNEYDSNLKLKLALCEKAEALKDSEEWRVTTDKLIALQREWKTIGPVPHKKSDEVWKRFISACDYFFDRKNKEQASHKDVERNNLKKKLEQIEKLKALKAGTPTIEEVRAIITEFNGAGHVPFRDKDKVYKEFHALVDELFATLNVNRNKSRLDSFSSNMEQLSGEKSHVSLAKERERLMRQFETLKNEVKTYENNMGFLTSTSKSGNSLLKDFEKKLERLKEEMNVIVQKVAIIDTKLKKDA